MVCKFNNTIAIKYGIKAALIAEYLAKRVVKSQLIVDDLPWVKVTQKKLAAVFPFMGVGSVAYTIKKLKKADIISIRKLNKSHFDNSNFYTFTIYGLTLLKGEEDCGDKKN